MQVTELVKPTRRMTRLDAERKEVDRSMRLKDKSELKRQKAAVTEKPAAPTGESVKGLCKSTRLSARTSKVVKVQPNVKRKAGRPRKTSTPIVKEVIDSKKPEDKGTSDSVAESNTNSLPDVSGINTRSSRSGRRVVTSTVKRTTAVKAKLSKAPPVRKSKGHHRAKILLERAKRTGAKKDISPKSESLLKKQSQAPQRREFHLPATSIRSSRKIIPNKRFLLEETIGSATHAKSPKAKEDVRIPSGECVLELGSSVLHTTGPSVTSPYCAELAKGHYMGLLDQPLIVDGKRERKPSVKLIQKLSEEYVPERRSPIKSSERSLRTDRKCLEIDRDIGATRRSGKIILQKAKFRLNQAALNRSKAALACSLKAQMRKEDRQLRKTQSKEAVPSSTSYSSSPPEHKLFSHFGLKPTPALVLSPLKFGLSAAASETAVFGASSLPAGRLPW